MPSNEIQVKLQVSDSAALTKVAEAMGAAGQNVSGRVGGEYQTMAQAVGALKDIQTQLGRGQQLTGATVRETAGGSFRTGGNVEEKKALGPGGYLAGIATAVGAIYVGFKKLMDMSSVMSTFMSTTGKIIATAVDLMLAPLMPIFTRIMVWVIQSVFPIATKLGDWLGSMPTGVAAGALVAGYVGLKITTALLDKAGTGIATALGNALPTDKLGTAISTAFFSAKAGLANWAENVALNIMTAFDTVREVLKNWYDNVARGISSAFNTVTDALSTWYTSVAKGIQSKFNSVVETLSEWYTSVAKGISSKFNTVTDTLSDWYTSIATGISKKFNTVTDALSTWYTSVATGISSKFNTVTDQLSTWYTSIATGISKAMTGAATFAKNVGESIVTYMNDAADMIKNFGTKVGTAIVSGANAATDAVTKFGKNVASALSAALTAGSQYVQKIGAAIGGAISNSMGAMKGWGRMGGMIGAGIAVVGIGAAIGYHMYKTYKEHQEGTDIYDDKTMGEAVPMLQRMYGVTESQAVAAWEQRDKIGGSAQLKEMFEEMNAISTEIRLTGGLSAGGLGMYQGMTEDQQRYLRNNYINEYGAGYGIERGTLYRQLYASTGGYNAAFGGGGTDLVSQLISGYGMVDQNKNYDAYIRRNFNLDDGTGWNPFARPEDLDKQTYMTGSFLRDLGTVYRDQAKSGGIFDMKAMRDFFGERWMTNASGERVRMSEHLNLGTYSDEQLMSSITSNMFSGAGGNAVNNFNLQVMMDGELVPLTRDMMLSFWEQQHGDQVGTWKTP